MVEDKEGAKVIVSRLWASAVGQRNGRKCRMKLEIMGFSQQGLMDLGLGIEDAMLLRWFVDFQGSSRMKPIADPETGKTYHWVNFRKVVEDLPVITKSDRWISERFNKLVTCGLLEKYSTTSAIGRVSAFRIAENEDYLSLISMSVKTDMAHVSKNRHGMSVKTDMAMSAATDMVSNTNSLLRNNNTVDSQLEDNYCPELSQNETPGQSPAQSPAVIKMPLTGSAVYLISQSQVDKWSGLYPAVDVMQELRKMVGWCEGHPTQKKTGRGVLRFINSWLAKEQDRGGRKTVSGNMRTPVSNAAHEGLQGGEITW